MAKACFNPRGAVKLWERMSEVENQMIRGGKHSEYFSTHPSNTTRINNFHEWMASAENIYSQNCKDTEANFKGFFDNARNIESLSSYKSW
jgi:predicted Zn-dependent protease